jgi:SAM-dependent methyltransferase
MEITELQRNWDELGQRDPLWAILSDPAKKGGRWDLEEFFQTGVNEVEGVIKYLESLKVDFPRRKALDFGCGVGRLTQALAPHFQEVCGVDIAPSMLEQANAYNRHGGRCKYFLNQTDDLKLFADDAFDFIYTMVVLQHMEPAHSKNYVREFVRVLAPGGVLVFQLPSEIGTGLSPLPKKGLKEALKGWLAALRGRPPAQPQSPEPDELERKIAMYGVKREEVEALLKGCGARVLDVVPDHSAGPPWLGFRYCVSK